MSASACRRAIPSVQMGDSFARHRQLLFGIAYRMLGTVADAEDVLQEAHVRWSQADPHVMKSPKAWLISVVTRLSIDQLRSARRQREEYVGVWLPEPLAGAASTAGPDEQAALADTLGIAFMHLLEKLEPVERAVYLLREVFGQDYDAIAETVGKSGANCRQILSRAKGRLHGRIPTESTVSPAARAVVERFRDACLTGDLSSLLAVLTVDAVLYTDGGPNMRAARRPIVSADRVARFYVGLHERAFVGTSPLLVEANGELGLLLRRPGGRTDLILFQLHEGRIRSLYMLSNPEKLRVFLKQQGVSGRGEGCPSEKGLSNFSAAP